MSINKLTLEVKQKYLLLANKNMFNDVKKEPRREQIYMYVFLVIHDRNVLITEKNINYTNVKTY